MVTTVSDHTKHTGSYEVVEASDYLRVTMPDIPGSKVQMSSTKLIRWIRYGLADTSLVAVPGVRLLITFEDLISMRVISFMRLFGIRFKEIRAAHSWLKNQTGHHRPFATERIWIEDLGAMDIYAEMEDILAVANRGGQLAFRSLVKEKLVRVHNMTFDHFGVASSWTADEWITIDPSIQFGRPCISGTRIPTSDIVGMFRAGDSCEFLAASYGISLAQVERAIAWEDKIASR